MIERQETGAECWENHAKRQVSSHTRHPNMRLSTTSLTEAGGGVGKPARSAD